MSLLELDNLHYRYPGQTQWALAGASLSLPAGVRVALLGRNGCGKSTMLLHCNGILQPMQGTVRFAGQVVSYQRASLLELRRRVGIVFQNPDDQLFSASVAQDISFGPLNLGLSQPETRQRVAAVAELCQISDLLDRPTHALSGGEKARVALAGVLAMEPALLIADEVTANLDPWMRRQLFAIFQQLISQGKTILLATHDVEFARHWADLIVIMAAGRVIAAAAADRIFADEDLLAQTGLDQPWYTPFTQVQEDGKGI
jgi:cobalt/nickel transport system ATP-binding protein